MKNSILVVAAHPDDEVLGCGGAISRWSAENNEVNILILADGEKSRLSGSNGQNESEIIDKRKKSAEKACQIMGCDSIDIMDLPDNRLDGVDLLDIVVRIESHIDKFKPHTVLTHHAGDVNIDHRIVHDAVIVACRPQPGCPVNELLFFEVCSSTEWRPPGSGIPFNPNYFVDISKTLELKLQALESYSGELREFPHPRSLKAVEHLARWRGGTVGVEAAEAFIIGRKLI